MDVDHLRVLTAGPLESQFPNHPQGILTEDKTHMPEFRETKASETFTSMPSIEIPVSQDDPEYTATPGYNSDNTEVICGESAIAQLETNEEMAKAEFEETERNWAPRPGPGLEESDTK